MNLELWYVKDVVVLLPGYYMYSMQCTSVYTFFHSNIATMQLHNVKVTRIFHVACRLNCIRRTFYVVHVPHISRNNTDSMSCYVRSLSDIHVLNRTYYTAQCLTYCSTTSGCSNIVAFSASQKSICLMNALRLAQQYFYYQSRVIFDFIA